MGISLLECFEFLQFAAREAFSSDGVKRFGAALVPHRRTGS